MYHTIKRYINKSNQSLNINVLIKRFLNLNIIILNISFEYIKVICENKSILKDGKYNL